MTSEELEQDLKEVNDRLTEFAEREEKLTNKEWRLQQRLLKEKHLLERIKQVRKTRDTIQEIKLMTELSVIKAASTQHPIINYLMQIKIRSNIWG